MNDLLLAVAIFLCILGILTFLRMKIGSNFELKNPDILIALIPVALWLILTGKIQKLEFGEFKIEAAFVEASSAVITKQITTVKLPVEAVKMDAKRGVEEIPRLIRDKTEALTFKLGHGGYYGPAIEEYLRQLTASPVFNWVIINGANGEFIGLLDARGLASLFMQSSRQSDDFARWLSKSDVATLRQLPDFIGAEEAIHSDADKQTALEKMESLDVAFLPVVDTQGRFAGVVDRSRLTASLIIDVAKKVQ